MIIKKWHAWDVDAAGAIRIQETLRRKVSLKDEAGTERISILAGADIAYERGGDSVFAGVVLLSAPGMEIVETAVHSGRVSFPYIPGLLSFREGPVLLKAFEKLEAAPDVVIFDGQGIAHPREMGLASHMGLLLDTPSIGCAKTRLLGEHEEPGKERGDSAWLRNEGKIIGVALRTKKNVKPVYVSPGHKVSLERAAKIVLESCRGYRLPEPVRQAHLLVNRHRVKGT